MTDSDFAQLVTRVLGSSTPRVWSLLVTMFGDLALAPQARLSGGTVNAITASIGIKPEATRVALHRLRKEDWIESHRTGRQTRYALTAHGRTQTTAAAPRVYSPAPTDLHAYLVLENPSLPTDWPTDQDTATTVQIGPKAVVTTASAKTDQHLQLVLTNKMELPRWISNKLCPPDIQSASRDLSQRFKKVLDDHALDKLTLLQRTAIRVVVVHEWRRLILRTPAFPETLLPDQWHGAECRTAFHKLLTRLPVPILAALENAIEAG